MPIADYNPYSTIEPLIGKAVPSWVGTKAEQLRVASYDIYEMMYWTVQETFKLAQRGSDTAPIYIPTGRTIVETTHRYMANEMHVISDPDFGTTEQQQQALIFWRQLARRERFYSKFNTGKRNGIIRGDWAFHLRGDQEREEGARISIETIHPGRLFEITNDDDDLIGWHIIDHVTEGTTKAIRRTTYRKVTERGGPSEITMEIAIFEAGAWGGPGQDGEEKILRTVQTLESFPAPIDQLPVYHIPNGIKTDEDDHRWGSSQLRGLERVQAAVNQSISDEEIELVLNGLGVYATDMDKPLDAESGLEVEWDLGPGRVVQKARGGVFERITGTVSVAPHQDHLAYMHDQIDQAAGTPAVAKGRVDVSVAESGVALAMQMGPLIARTTEQEQTVTDVSTNLLFDLGKWMVAYEGTQWGFMIDQVRLLPVYGDKIPVNRKERFTEIMAMATAAPIPLMPVNVAWEELRKLGYELPEEAVMWNMIIEQKALAASAEMDGIARSVGDQDTQDRITSELSEEDVVEEEEGAE